MAKKKDDKPKNVLERAYTVPLRREYMKAPTYKRTKKAVTALKEFMQKHMKSENVLIGKYANQYLWKDGIKNPPHHIKVNAVKDDTGKVTVELVDLPGKAKRAEEKQKALEKAKDAKDKKKEDAKKKAEPTKAAPAESKKVEAETELEKKLADVKTEKSEEAKEVQKEEIKELKKEVPKDTAQKPAPQPKNQEPKANAPKL